MQRESVWDYPRPPRLEPSSKTVRVMLGEQVIAESSRAYRVLETSHPPTWYIPKADIKMELLRPTRKSSFCEWKGQASYWSAASAENAAWSYESPSASFKPIQGHLAFYPSRFECYVDDERVTAQPGDFYGGWITQDIAGPFKGGAGTSGW